MSAANTDLLRKKKSNFSTTLNGSIDDSETTIALSSASGLPTGTAITITIDRVDSNGVSTPTLVERVTGVVSGNNLTNCLRGEDGTSAQAHASGAVVEDIWDAETWNDSIDAFLVGHDQAGAHKSGMVLTLPQINDTSSDHQYVFAVNELGADRTTTLPLLTGNDEFVFKDHAVTMTNKTLTTPVIASIYQDAGKTKLMTTPNTASDTLAAIAATQTFTNKRITKRVGTDTSSATPTPAGDDQDVYTVTALAEAATFGAPTGTPTNGQTLVIRILDNGTARALAFNAIYRFSSEIPAPTTTVLSKTMYLGFMYNSAASKWDCLCVANNF